MQPKIGIVIGTHGTPLYIKLHLETRKRLYPEVPVLVHDDCSEEIMEINALCRDYGCDFAYTTEREGQNYGDMCAFWQGLLWAERQKIDILVKFSRRLIPLSDFRPSLIKAAEDQKFATFSNLEHKWGIPIRSEAMGMRMDQWIAVAMKLKGINEHRVLHPCPECFYQLLAIEISPHETGFGIWDWLSDSRGVFNGNHMWHETHSYEDYVELHHKLFKS